MSTLDAMRMVVKTDDVDRLERAAKKFDKKYPDPDKLDDMSLIFALGTVFQSTKPTRKVSS